MKRLLPLLILPLVFCTSCFNKTEDNPIRYVEPEIQVSHNYDEVEDKHLLFDDIFTLDDSHYCVYFYSLNCTHCENLKNYIIEKALENNPIYFVKASSKIELKEDVSSTIGAGKSEEIAILGYPSLIEIGNKIVTKNVAGATAIKLLLN